MRCNTVPHFFQLSFLIYRNYKTEKITSTEKSEIEKKRLGAMKIPTLTKGFLRSMTPTLGVATLNESDTTTNGLSSIGEGENECSNWTNVVPVKEDRYMKKNAD